MVSYKKISRSGNDYFEEPRYLSLTKMDLLLSIIAIMVLGVIGMRYLDTWGRINIMEMIFCLIALISIDPIRTGSAGLFKKKENRLEFKPFSLYTLPRFLILFILFFGIQAISQLPFTIENIEKGFSIMFASVAEEMFFRGLIISIFKKMSFRIRDPDKKKIWKSKLLGDFDLNFRPIMVLGFGVQALFFAYIHQNYYGNMRMMIALFVGGFMLAFFYSMWDDLTANILGHFILNIATAITSGLFILTF